MMGEQIVRLGASEVDEERLLHKLDALKKDIVEYAVKYESWFDCSFKIPFEHQNDRPREGQVLNALFATTSRFQPKSQMFARTVEKMLNVPAIVLADRGKISEWCEAIARDLNEYFAAGPESAPPPPIIAKRIAQPNDLTGKIVVASSGYNMILNDFAIIEADFAHEVILRRIGAKDVSGDVLQGAEMPDLTALVQDYWKEVRFVAFKSLSRWEDNRPQFWGDRQLRILWDGTPRWFDRLD
jgi:restriction system protein